MPTLAETPAGGKEVRKGGEPASNDKETIVWRFSIADLNGQWGWRLKANVWWGDVLPKLQHIETMTWADVQRAAGGRSQGNNSHPVKVANLTKDAKDRLRELSQDDVAELFSLRLSGSQRVYGIRDRRALKLLWYDPYHGNNAKAVYPVKRR